MFTHSSYIRERDYNYWLSFLAIYIELKENTTDQNLRKSVYCKETLSGQYLKFHSECPIFHKVAVVKTIAIRVLRYCSDEKGDILCICVIMVIPCAGQREFSRKLYILLQQRLLPFNVQILRETYP